MSLRKQEQTFAVLSVVLLTANLDLRLSFLFALAVIKVGDQSLYQGLAASTRTVKDLKESRAPQQVDNLLLKILVHSLSAYCISWKMNDDRTAHERYAEYINLADAAEGKHVKGPRSRRIKELTLHLSGIPDIATSYHKALDFSGQFKSL